MSSETKESSSLAGACTSAMRLASKRPRSWPLANSSLPRWREVAECQEWRTECFSIEHSH
eukprot:8164-Heterococcus_DN1.PRE.31